MVNYKVGSYIRLSRDESYSNSDSIDNQIKMTDFYCEENKLEVIDKYIDNGYVEQLLIDLLLNNF